MIEVTNLTKSYGDTLAVDNLSFTVRPGIVTGFLGPNGAGKSTTMRMILGLDAPTSGSAAVGGRSLAEHDLPLSSLGFLLEPGAVHPSRSAYDHLRALAATNGISTARVEHVLDLVGLGEVAKRRSGGFSLGMGQRLGIAGALLGDPEEHIGLGDLGTPEDKITTVIDTTEFLAEPAKSVGLADVEAARNHGEASAVQDEWSISADGEEAGSYIFSMIRTFSGVEEAGVEDLGGRLVWPDTEIELCDVNVLGVGDGFVQIGIISPTTEGCPGMLPAFVDFGLPETACLFVRSDGTDDEHCARLVVD